MKSLYESILSKSGVGRVKGAKVLAEKLIRRYLGLDNSRKTDKLVDAFNHELFEGDIVFDDRCTPCVVVSLTPMKQKRNPDDFVVTVYNTFHEEDRDVTAGQLVKILHPEEFLK